MTTTSCNTIILVIEDDPPIRELLTDTLTEQGYMVVAVGQGDKALALLPSLRPALITLDLNLPGLSGDFILHQLRQQPATQTLPVIVISAQTIPPVVQVQAQASIPKPFDLNTYLETVQQFVPPPATGTSIDQQPIPLTQSVEFSRAIGGNPIPTHPIPHEPPLF